MNYIGFNSIQECKAWRKSNGGYIFISEDKETIIWFNIKYTPSDILIHPITKGLSGKLI